MTGYLRKKNISIGKEELTYLDEGNKEVLLLLHGNMTSSVHFGPLFARLHDDFRCLAPDLRGFGDSSYSHRFDSLEELAEDVSLFMEKLNIPRAFVAGWSTGGGIAMKLAAMHPEKVRGLFIIAGVGCKGFPIYKEDVYRKSTGEAYANKEEMASAARLVAPVLRILEQQDTEAMKAVWKKTVYTVSEPEPAQNDIWINETLKQRNLADVDWALAAFNISDELGPYGQGDGSIHRIICPSVFTCGDKDVTIPPETVEENVRAMGPRTRLIRYEPCGHSPLVDCPDRLAEDIRDFCASCSTMED